MLPPTRGGGGGRAPQQLTPRITSRSVMPDQTLVEGEGERERERERDGDNNYNHCGELRKRDVYDYMGALYCTVR